MDQTVKQEISVGAFVIVGAALLVALLFWLTDKDVGGKGIPVEIQFADAAGVKVGDPVMVSGVKKGRVAVVRLESVGKVAVTLSVDPDVAPRIDATAAVAALDFLGSKVLIYSPGVRSEPLQPGTVIVGTKKAELADMAGGLASRADELLGNATALVSDQLGADVHNTLVATQRAMDALAKMGGGQLVSQATSTLAATERTMARLDSLLNSMGGRRIDTLTANLALLSRNLGKATASLDTLLGGMARGEGSLGRMAADTMLYVNLNETLAALTSLMKDLKERPGRYLTVKVF